jgi:hypothetical protein
MGWLAVMFAWFVAIILRGRLRKVAVGGPF